MGNQQGRNDEFHPQRLWVEIPVGQVSEVRDPKFV
nr:MAG TPA: hypothetical protein [Caudoviricetes sp.]